MKGIHYFGKLGDDHELCVGLDGATARWVAGFTKAVIGTMDQFIKAFAFRDD